MTRPTTAVLTALIILLIVLLTPASSRAGTYELRVCIDPNQTENAATWVKGNDAYNLIQNLSPNCIGDVGGLIGVFMGGGSGTNFPENSYGGWLFNAPSGTSFTSADWRHTMQNGGNTGTRCLAAYRSDLSLLGGQDCKSGAVDLAWTPQAWTGNSQTFLLAMKCSVGPCGYGTSFQLTSNFDNISLRLTDNTKPAISDDSGLVKQDGWVRGSWPISWRGSDSLGVKSDRYTIAGIERGSNSGCSPSYYEAGKYYYGTSLVPCPASKDASYTVNTSDYGDGAQPLTIESLDSIDNVAVVAKTIKVDNSPPTAPAIIVANTRSTPTKVSLLAADPQSGISDYSCKVDGGAWSNCTAEVSLTLVNGPHTICAKAANNSRDISGAVNQSTETCQAVVIGKNNPVTRPPASAAGPVSTDSKIGDGLRINNYRLRSSNKVTKMTTVVQVGKTGLIKQDVFNKSGAEKILCSTSKQANQAGEVKMSCQLDKKTHQALAKRKLSVILRTSFVASGGTATEEIDAINLSRRK